MNYKTRLFITLSNNHEEPVSLREGLLMEAEPSIGLKIRICFKIHVVKDVIYDGENSNFFVELEDESSPDLEELTSRYEKEG